MRNRSLLLVTATVLLAVSCSTVGGQGYVRSPYSKNVWIRPAGASSYWIKADQGVLPWDSLFLAASRLTLDQGKRYFAIIEPRDLSSASGRIGSAGNFVAAGGSGAVETYTTSSPGTSEVTHFNAGDSRRRSAFPAALPPVFRIDLFDRVPDDLSRGALIIDADLTLKRLQSIKGVL